MKKAIRLYITLKDIGPYRIQLRLRAEIRKIIDKLLTPYLALKLVGIKNNYPKWKENNSYKQDSLRIYKNNLSEIPKYIYFEFLNEKKGFKFPIIWNNKKWERLWQFNLHYFDWLRNWIDISISNKNWIKETKIIKIIIDDWIDNNLAGRGDGWHSYTISLRIRNLIYLYRFFPEFKSKKRINSIWIQLKWLDKHKEKYHGGNHYLENLISLVIGSLQFDGQEANKIFEKNIKLLKNELENQILSDGGHEERSASYHTLILDRLIELGIVLNISKAIKPKWLTLVVIKMTEWLNSVIINNNHLPKFNDSPIDGCPNPKLVRDFSYSYLYLENYQYDDLRSLMINSLKEFTKGKKNYKYIKNFKKDKLSKLTFLCDTGWQILRPSKNWSLLFKCGESCPKHLPAHAHSDQLSFDLFYKGKPIFAEAGTSTYAINQIRDYERKYSAHNVIQFSLPSKKDKLDWIEPLDVWSSFRAGKKARGENIKSGIINNEKLWVSGSHDGYKNFGFNHNRRISIKNLNKDKIAFTLKDSIKTNKSLFFRLWIHLGPLVKKDLMSDFTKSLKHKNLKYKWIKTTFAEAFNKRSKRDSLLIEGFYKKGEYELIMNLEISPKILKK